jgi:hypothetical protein
METQKGTETRPTAGLRGASWNPALLPSDMKTAIVPLATVDGAQIVGYHYSCGGERACVMIMHPRELLATHYMVPYLLRAGFSCWVQGPRTVGNDLRLEHEMAIIDVAAGVSELRKIGYAKIVMLGNSGGAGLFAFYNQQSLLTPEKRLAKTPGGRPCKLPAASMPAVDGFVFVAPHPGQGRLLQNCVDPSVTDESDPFSTDPALDPFSAENGFRPHPERSQYKSEFIERYRDAQRRRIQRIDESAKAMIAERMQARARSKASPTQADSMRGAFNSIFTVWRTDADLRCFDLSLDPSDRRWGTVWGADPLASNLGAVGFGRVCTPESWLSTWSASSSNASFERCGSSIEQASLVIYYTGDNTVFPADVQAIVDTIAAKDKTRHDIRGNHHGHALAAGDPLGQDRAGGVVTDWLKSRF